MIDARLGAKKIIQGFSFGTNILSYTRSQKFTYESLELYWHEVIDKTYGSCYSFDVIKAAEDYYGTGAVPLFQVNLVIA